MRADVVIEAGSGRAQGKHADPQGKYAETPTRQYAALAVRGE